MLLSFLIFLKKSLDDGTQRTKTYFKIQ